MYVSRQQAVAAAECYNFSFFIWHCNDGSWHKRIIKKFYYLGREFAVQHSFQHLFYFWLESARAFGRIYVFCSLFFSITHQQTHTKKQINKWINEMMMIFIRLESQAEIEKQWLQIEFSLSIIICYLAGESARNMLFLTVSHKNEWYNQISNEPLNSFQICILKFVSPFRRWTMENNFWLKWNAHL